MFKRSKMKIVGLLLGVLAILLAGTLCVIYMASYRDVMQTNRELLERYAAIYWVEGNPSEQNESEAGPENEPDDAAGKPEDRPAGGLPDSAEKPADARQERVFELSSFSSVAFAEDGTISDINNDSNSGLSEDALIALAESATAEGRTLGSLNDWVYYIETQDDITLVVLIDNTITQSNVSTLIQYTLLFGAAALVVVLLVSMLLANWIIRPLEENDQKQRQFISDAEHELKTPIAVISANLELLERENGSGKWLDNIRWENNRMGKLVKQMLHLTRTENLPAEMEVIELGQLVTGSVLPFACIAFEKGHTLETQIQEGISVYGNAEQLEKLISILTDNAITYAAENSPVVVTLCSRRNMAVLSVSNVGEEIPQAERNKLFERFYRASEARGGDENHYGLGLAIAKAVVTAHHGTIAVDCKDGNIIFTVTLPQRNG